MRLPIASVSQSVDSLASVSRKFSDYLILECSGEGSRDGGIILSNSFVDVPFPKNFMSLPKSANFPRAMGRYVLSNGQNLFEYTKGLAMYLWCDINLYYNSSRGQWYLSHVYSTPTSHQCYIKIYSFDVAAFGESLGDVLRASDWNRVVNYVVQVFNMNHVRSQFNLDFTY